MRINTVVQDMGKTYVGITGFDGTEDFINFVEEYGPKRPGMLEFRNVDFQEVEDALADDFDLSKMGFYKCKFIGCNTDDLSFINIDKTKNFFFENEQEYQDFLHGKNKKEVVESNNIQTVKVDKYAKIDRDEDGKYYPKNKEELKKLCEDENINLGTINTSKITDMSRLFFDSTRKDFSGIETWDTSHVKDMSSMFSLAKYFNHSIGNWDVSKVTDMSNMFEEAKVFNQSIGNWDVSKVENMSYMFLNAKSFNQPIGKWNVSNVKNMYGMFEYAKSFNQPIGDWNVSNVEEMFGMFDGAIAFNQPIANWNTSKVKRMGRMFYNADSFNQPIGNWNISSVDDSFGFSEMLRYAKSFNQINDGFSKDDLKYLNQDSFRKKLKKSLLLKKEVKENAFDRLSIKQKDVVVKSQRKAKEIGYNLHYNNKIKDAQKEFTRFMKDAKEHKCYVPSKIGLKPKANDIKNKNNENEL